MRRQTLDIKKWDRAIRMAKQNEDVTTCSWSTYLCLVCALGKRINYVELNFDNGTTLPIKRTLLGIKYKGFIIIPDRNIK